jgi:(p)ppGpp synthase/HD superfamily hydrolase
MSLLEDAIEFAVEAHSGQVRKFDSTPYISHPLSVMGMMTEFTNDPAILAACVLHDTVEDCEDVTLEVIHERFGELVAGYVFFVTEKSQKSDGNRKTRKQIDREHYSRGSSVSQNIKICDFIHNVPSMVLYDPEFAKLYIEEKLDLLVVITRADPTLKQRAYNLLYKLRRMVSN